ncbi:MAG: DUF3784 domain-containing protein [Cyclobacteriaceae bacterium]|nr:DUF3784 domain-containing protein [Cyclobacteriaceae bacterium]
MEYVIIGLALLLFSLGFIVTTRNAKYLLSGYNTMSEEEREKVNIVEVVSFLRRFHVFLGLTFLAIGLVLYYFISSDVAGFFITAYPILAYIWFIWRSRKFYKKVDSGGYKAGIIVLFVTLVFVMIIFGLGYRDNTLVLTDDGLNLTGMYGVKLKTEDLISFELVEQCPAMKSRLNGFATGNMRKGIFKSAEGERVRLLINDPEKPVIKIVPVRGRTIYYNSRKYDSAGLFKKLQENLPLSD